MPMGSETDFFILGKMAGTFDLPLHKIFYSSIMLSYTKAFSTKDNQYGLILNSSNISISRKQQN